MVEQQEWVHFRKIDWDDPQNNRFNIDTRDFHCGYRLSEDEHKDIKTIRKTPKQFFLTKDELVKLLERYFEESGGEGEWRYFDLDYLGLTVNNWMVKYLRIYREQEGFLVCNSDHYVLRREILNSKVNKKHLNHH